MSRIGFHRASVADAQEIAPFHLACWRDGYTGLVPKRCLDDLDGEDSVGKWTERLSRGEDTTTVAVGDGSVIGLVTVGLYHARAPLPTVWRPPSAPPSPSAPEPTSAHDHVTELRSLYVAAGHRGEGLGRRLMDMALGGDPASVWVFEDALARAFYTRTGWILTGERYTDAWTGLAAVRLVRAQRASAPNGSPRRR